MIFMKNTVMVGDYKDKAIAARGGNLLINTEGFKFISLDDYTVDAFTEIPETLAKKTRAIYIEFRDGKKCIANVTEKVFKAFEKACYHNPNLEPDPELIDEYLGEKNKTVLRKREDKDAEDE